MNNELIISNLSFEDITELRELFLVSGEYVSARSLSDYWLYSRLFNDTCIIAKKENMIVGAILAFRNQNSNDSYIQDVVVKESERGKGIGKSMMRNILETLSSSSCVWLTSEPTNNAATILWNNFGFTNPKADYEMNGFWVTKNLKGPGKDRVIFTLKPNAEQGVGS